MKLPRYIQEAIVSGPVPKLRPLEEMRERYEKHLLAAKAIRDLEELDGLDDISRARLKKLKKLARSTKPTDGERVLLFAHEFLVVPEGSLAGQPLILDAFQQAFILAVFDSPEHVDEAILSIARRNGKSFVIAVILLAFIVGPLARLNTRVASAANSRDQAALVFGLMQKMLDLSPKLAGKYRIVSSKKQVFGVAKNVEYQALAAEAKTGHGQSLYVLLLDEAGQVEEPTNDYIDMLRSSQGSYEDPRFFIVSTQAPSDAAFLSQQIDAAIRAPKDNIVVHLYAALPNCALDDKAEWAKANPGLGKFRSERDIKKQVDKALELPSNENGVRNLLLNQRVSLEALFMAPTVWRANDGPVDEITRRLAAIHLGLDLSRKVDLSSAVAAWRNDEDEISLETYAFAPTDGLKQRELRDKAPYQQWAKDGNLTLTPGAAVEYKWVSQFLAEKFRGCRIATLQFDRWKIDDFKEAAVPEFLNMIEEWVPVGQGTVSMNPRLDAFEQEMVQRRVRHGSHPLLNLAASHAIAVSNPAGDRKLDKNKSTQRIDPMVAAVMALYPCSDGGRATAAFDVAALIG